MCVCSWRVCKVSDNCQSVCLWVFEYFFYSFCLCFMNMGSVCRYSFINSSDKFFTFFALCVALSVFLASNKIVQLFDLCASRNCRLQSQFSTWPVYISFDTFLLLPFFFPSFIGTFGSERRQKKYLDMFECDMTWWRWLCCYFGVFVRCAAVNGMK